MITRRPFLLVVLALAAVAGAANPPPILPTAPIVDFRLPVFNEAGFRIWELRGSEAAYDHTAQRAEIRGLRLRVYSGDERELVENEVESPLAIAHVEERKVSGPGLIRLTGVERGRDYEVRGEDWTYQETYADAPDGSRRKTKSVVIRKNVVVTFPEDIGDILR